jgi:hypothetical protein
MRCIMPGVSESRANARHPRSSECSPVAPHLAGTSLRLAPRASPSAMPLSHAPQSARSSPHPLPAHPHFSGPVRRRGIGCPRDKSCRRARRSGRRAPPSPYDTAFSEGSGSLPVFVGSSPITFFLTIFESTSEVRALCSAGITRPRHSYDPVRLPPGPPPIRDVEVATLAHDGSPPITRIAFPTCRAHYPGGTNGCSRRLLPRSRGLPQMAGGSASALSLTRPAQALLTLRPTGSLSRQKRPLSRGSSPSGYPAEPLVSYQTNRQVSG